MYELTISISYQKYFLIEDIAKSLEHDIKLTNGIIICGLFDGRACLSIAVKDNEKEFIKALVLDVVSNHVVSYFKYEYLNDHINNSLVKENKKTLIKALTEFDKQTDIELVKKNLVFNNNIVLDSFYHFRLTELKKRWAEICELVNINLPNLISGDCLDDMMKFLISSGPIKTDEIYIIEKNDYLVLKGKILGESVIKFNKKSKDTEQKLISALISLSPKRIYLSSDVYSECKFLKNVENLFDGRVIITH